VVETRSDKILINACLIGTTMIVSDGPTKHGKMFKPLTSLLSSALAVAASCPTLRDLFPAEGLYEHNLYDFVVKSSHIV
jgi:hypothetical protein